MCGELFFALLRNLFLSSFVCNEKQQWTQTSSAHNVCTYTHHTRVARLCCCICSTKITIGTNLMGNCWSSGNSSWAFLCQSSNRRKSSGVPRLASCHTYLRRFFTSDNTELLWVFFSYVFCAYLHCRMLRNVVRGKSIILSGLFPNWVENVRLEWKMNLTECFIAIFTRDTYFFEFCIYEYYGMDVKKVCDINRLRWHMFSTNDKVFKSVCVMNRFRRSRFLISRFDDRPWVQPDWARGYQ